MNREIKFRVWDRALNKMITQENVKWLLDTVNTGDYYTDYTYSGEEWYPAYDILTIFDYFEDIQDRYIEDTSIKRFELMQYTGLHDKNGKEIYEGDIVKIKYRDEDIGKVIYEYNGFSIDVTNMNKNYGRVDFVNNFMEVIGNIYDNPELLGGEE